MSLLLEPTQSTRAVLIPQLGLRHASKRRRLSNLRELMTIELSNYIIFH